MTHIDVINYIRDYFTSNNLVSLELTDDQIYNIAIKPTIIMLNQYIPAIKVTKLNNPKVIDNSFSYEFDSNEKIISILQVIPDFTIQGMSTVGTFPIFLNIDSMLNMYQTILKQQHYKHINWKFIPPRTLVILEPIIIGDIGVIYTVEHSPDLSTVDNAFQWTIYKLALAHAKRALGTARKKYTSFDTPFGQILIDIDIRMEGEEEIKQIEEELKSLTPMIPIIVA